MVVAFFVLFSHSLITFSDCNRHALAFSSSIPRPSAESSAPALTPVVGCCCARERNDRRATCRRYKNAVWAGFELVNSETGRRDRLQIIFNSNRFELLQQKELHRHRDYELNNGTHRSPLFVHLRDRNSGAEFIVMTNHLARTNAELRTQQVIGLREWARDQSVAVINIGDFNMDFDFHTERGNDAFPELLRNNVWQWVRPTELVDTNWSDPDGDGHDNYPDSMLYFAFISGPAMCFRRDRNRPNPW